MAMRAATRSVALLLAAAIAPAVYGDKNGDKKKKGEVEIITQTLELLPDPPAAIKAEVGRMVFHTSPLTNKGLLSQQVREGIKAIWRVNRGATVVKLRALVAGTGDMRRVQAIVSEMFSEKHQPLPVLSVVQVGALPMEASQVLIEATSLTKKPVNPDGLAFISGKGALAPLKEHGQVLPLAEKSIADLNTALTGVGLTGADVLRVTCFQSSLEDISKVQSAVAQAFPAAVVSYAQTQRSPSEHVVECEAVARLKTAAGANWKVLNPPGLTASPNFSQLALAGPGPVVLSGGQLAFRTQDSDVRLCFDRMKKQLEENGASMKSVFWSSIYPLSRTVTDKVRAIRFEYYDKANPPASTVMNFEGLPSLDASFSLEVIAGLK
jgi:enamine deaminase RidA (YjgF/YER057c/UK114 family)